MAKQKTHFEQVPVKIAEKVAAEETKRKEAKSVNTGTRPRTAIAPVEATIVVSAKGVN